MHRIGAPEQPVAPDGRIEAPRLVPLDEIRPGAEPETRVRREERAAPPSLPFSGFSVLALLLSGLAATSAGRRLHAATAPARPAG
jgi:hypothetical protein